MIKIESDLEMLKQTNKIFKIKIPIQKIKIKAQKYQSFNM